MKKVVIYNGFSLCICNSKDYKIIEQDGEKISEKYVNIDGISFYDNTSIRINLYQVDVLIRGVYRVDFPSISFFDIRLEKFKYYDFFSKYYKKIPEILENMNMKNSSVNFNTMKICISGIFIREMHVVSK